METPNPTNQHKAVTLTAEQVACFLCGSEFEPNGSKKVVLEFNGLYEQCATLGALLRMLEYGFNHLENIESIKDEIWDLACLTQIAQKLVPLKSIESVDYIHKVVTKRDS